MAISGGGVSWQFARLHYNKTKQKVLEAQGENATSKLKLFLSFLFELDKKMDSIYNDLKMKNEFNYELYIKPSF